MKVFLNKLCRAYYDVAYLYEALKVSFRQFKNMREIRHRDREDSKFMKRIWQKVGRYG